MNEPTSGFGRRPGYDLWVWAPGGVPPNGPAPAAGPVRIGDAERDTAVASLGDHFAAGRINQVELEERIDQAMQARFDSDIKPLFVDLPSTPAGLSVLTQPQRIPLAPGLPPLFWLAPLLLVATIVGAIALGAPWLLWGLLWMMVAGRFWGRRGYGPAAGHHPR